MAFFILNSGKLFHLLSACRSKQPFSDPRGLLFFYLFEFNDPLFIFVDTRVAQIYPSKLKNCGSRSLWIQDMLFIPSRPLLHHKRLGNFLWLRPFSEIETRSDNRSHSAKSTFSPSYISTSHFWFTKSFGEKTIHQHQIKHYRIIHYHLRQTNKISVVCQMMSSSDL